jgi:hypothetical protein
MATANTKIWSALGCNDGWNTSERPAAIGTQNAITTIFHPANEARS